MRHVYRVQQRDMIYDFRSDVYGFAQICANPVTSEADIHRHPFFAEASEMMRTNEDARISIPISSVVTRIHVPFVLLSISRLPMTYTRERLVMKEPGIDGLFSGLEALYDTMAKSRECCAYGTARVKIVKKCIDRINSYVARDAVVHNLGSMNI
jgi:hypothetical protein